MGEAQTRKEAREKDEALFGKLKDNMQKALRETSLSKGGLMILRYLLHESGFLAPLSKETSLGVNKELLIANEAKRMMYLILRSYMDEDTVMRIEFDKQEKTEGE